MAKGFYSAQDGHPLLPLAPVDITGGKTAAPFSMVNYAHASIFVLIGISAAAFTKIILNACSDAAGDGATAIAFDIYKQETAAGDVLSGRTAVTSAGFTPSANDGIYYVIEIDAAQLPAGLPYVQVQLTNGANSVIASVFAILSGARFASDQSATAIA
jgi:hypothetical protein